MTQFYLYASDVSDLLDGKLNFAVDIRTDAPKDYAKYSAAPFILSVDINLDEHLDRLLKNAAEALNKQLTFAKIESEKRRIEIEAKIEALTPAPSTLLRAVTNVSV